MHIDDVLVSTIAPYGQTAVVPDGSVLMFAGAGVPILRGGVHDPVCLAAYLASAVGQAELARVDHYDFVRYVGKQRFAVGSHVDLITLLIWFQKLNKLAK